MNASDHSAKSRLALRTFHQISALLNSTLNHCEIRRRAIEAATVLLDAEAGSLLLRDARTGQLYFEVAVGDRGDRVREIRIEPGQGIAGYVAQTGKAVLVHDVRKDRRFFRQADAKSGFVTRNMICVPLTARDRLLGVLQALNKKHGRRFGRGDLENGIALGHQVGIALENAQLYEDINRLFEGFIAASVQAIESRDPVTSGHSHRVAAMACGLAQAVDRADRGRYGALHFTEDQMKELRYAAVLHDFGKVGVPEALLVKADKLYPGRMALVRARFDFIKRTLEVQALRRKVELLSGSDRRAVPPLVAELDAGLVDSLKEIDVMLARLEAYNHATVLPPGGTDELDEMARRSYESFGGVRSYLTPGEVAALSVAQGNLSIQERHAIEAHVTETYLYLCKIPWTSGLKNVPAIAYTHHEKLDGTGYPRRITGDQIPVQARMVAIVDVYDALTAWDRPYKPAVPPCDALQVIHEQVRQGKLDEDLFDIFVNERVYARATGSFGTGI